MQYQNQPRWRSQYGSGGSGRIAAIGKDVEADPIKLLVVPTLAYDDSELRATELCECNFRPASRTLRDLGRHLPWKQNCAIGSNARYSVTL